MFVVATTLLLLATPTATDPVTEPAAPKSGKPRLICKIEGDTGSRLAAKKRCRTPADWEAEAAAQQRGHESPRSQSRNGTN